MAGSCYFWTGHTSSKEELLNQNLLAKQSFPTTFIQDIKSKQKAENQGTEKKRFTGLAEYNKLSKRHIFLKNVVKNSVLGKNKHYLPAEVPGKK